MAAAIIPIAATLLPVILPEIKTFIQLVETAFQKKAPPAAGPPPDQGPQKLGTVAQFAQVLLNSLNTSGFPQPDEQSLLAFIEGVFQDLKASGGLIAAPTTSILQPPSLPANGNFNVVKLDGKTLIVVP